MARGSWLYRAFGLILDSDFELSSLVELSEGARPADVEIRSRPLRATPAKAAVRVSWDQVCELSASGGNQLDVYPTSDAVPADVELSILGAGLALILDQRDILVLHGSCVEVDGVAMALIGPSGAGKSTIAGALGMAGHRVLSDGMTAIDVSNGEAWALPGLPLLKLLPDAAERLGFEPAQLARVHPGSPKLVCDASTAFSSERGRLGALLVLSTGAVELSRLGPSAAAFELTKNFFLIDELVATRAEAILRTCSSIVGRLEVHAFGRAGLDELPAAVELVAGLARRLRS